MPAEQGELLTWVADAQSAIETKANKKAECQSAIAAADGTIKAGIEFIRACM